MENVANVILGRPVRALLLMLTWVVVAPAPAWAWEGAPPELYHMCTQCHGEAGEGNRDVGAPVIQGLPEWYLLNQLTKFHDGIRGAHPKDIAGMRMRPMARALTLENIKSVAKYVAGLPRPLQSPTVKGSLVRGEAKFQLCVACHGPQGLGNPELGAPPLVGASDWYLLTQLHNFKNKARGFDPSVDPTGASMQGIAATLDDQGMLDVVSYINTLKPAH